MNCDGFPKDQHFAYKITRSGKLLLCDDCLIKHAEFRANIEFQTAWAHLIDARVTGVERTDMHLTAIELQDDNGKVWRFSSDGPIERKRLEESSLDRCIRELGLDK